MYLNVLMFLCTAVALLANLFNLLSHREPELLAYQIYPTTTTNITTIVVVIVNQTYLHIKYTPLVLLILLI